MKINEEFLKEKNVLAIKKNTNQTFNTTASTKIIIDTLHFKKGSELFFENNQIKIGKGIDKVRVDAFAWVQSQTAYSMLQIKKNNSEVARSIFPKTTTEYWRTQNVYTYIDVEEGDTIGFYLLFSSASTTNTINGGSYSGSNLFSVEEI